MQNAAGAAYTSNDFRSADRGPNRKRPMQIGMIADDLTSATDGAVQFARVGVGSVVTLDAGNVTGLAPWQLVALDTDSRAGSCADAAARVAAGARALRARDLLYKTVDSTIRGHLAVEMRAAQIAGGRPCTLFAPAFPANGRVTRAGRQYLNDVPLSRTIFSQDPYHPVTDDDICSIFARGGIHDVRVLNRAELCDRRTVNSALASAPCVVADAETDEDLASLVRVIAAPRDVLWVGSAGLARALGEWLAPGAHPSLRRSAANRLLVAVGSLNPASRRQLDALRRRGDALIVEINATLAMENSNDASKAALHAVGVTATTRCDARTVVVTSSSLPSGPRTAALTTLRVADAIASAVESLHQAEPFDGFVLTGGDTATRIARRLGVTGIEIDHEFAPGVATGTFLGPVSARVLTKAGGFGDDAMLVAACKYLRSHDALGATANGAAA
jgi:uncharacterized protein YgbK (DUF1537 family)